MIACIIEFAVRPGMEAAHQAHLRRLLAEVETIDGFLSKETFESMGGDGRFLTLSLWRDKEALAGWMAHPDHRDAMREGREHIFSSYRIRIAEVTREYALDAAAGRS